MPKCRVLIMPKKHHRNKKKVSVFVNSDFLDYCDAITLVQERAEALRMTYRECMTQAISSWLEMTDNTQ